MLYWKAASKTQVKGFNIMVMIFQPQGKGFPMFVSLQCWQLVSTETWVSFLCGRLFPSPLGGGSHPTLEQEESAAGLLRCKQETMSDNLTSPLHLPSVPPGTNGSCSACHLQWCPGSLFLKIKTRAELWFNRNSFHCLRFSTLGCCFKNECIKLVAIHEQGRRTSLGLDLVCSRYIFNFAEKQFNLLVDFFPSQ